MADIYKLARGLGPNHSPSGCDSVVVKGDDIADAVLLHAVARGDERALAVLYDRHAGWLYVRMNRRCGCADLVDQAVQDTFLALWNQAGRYRGTGDVGAFIWGIGLRRLIDAVRRDRAARAAIQTWWQRARVHLAAAEVVRSAEEEVLLGIERGRLSQALGQLSPELSAAIQSTVLDGLTCTQAGRLLGVPAGTVKSRCHRARIQLREVLA